jgi:gas vesicle protein
VKTEDDDVSMKLQAGSPLSPFTWLIAGVGIGAVTGMLLAPRSGKDTREWISTKCRSGIDTVNSKVRQTGQQVEEWVDQSQHQVREAVSAGRDAFSKAKSGTS